MSTMEKRALTISRGLIQVPGIVPIIGFFIMGVITYYTYNDSPLIPETLKDPGDKVFIHPSRYCW